MVVAAAAGLAGAAAVLVATGELGRAQLRHLLGGVARLLVLDCYRSEPLGQRDGLGVGVEHRGWLQRARRSGAPA